MNLSGSVGNRAVNRPSDVKQVQSLLNDNKVKPSLRVDGISGKRTIQAISWFQKRIVRLNSPDGRIDPGGKTWRSLNARDGCKPEKATPSRSSTNPDEKKEFRKERRQFVDPRVKENAKTKDILDKIFPYFKNTNSKVISGYLSDSDLFWKVNYHWEYLLWMIDHSQNLSIEPKYKKQLDSARAALLNLSPNPNHGYRTSATVGKPVDSSSMDVMTKRHKIIKQKKVEFKNITRQTDLISKSTRSPSCFHLAAAPVAHPGTSKHSTGYAIDIKGSAGNIKTLSKRLGASLVFDEKSHVHVEFKNGVNVPGK